MTAPGTPELIARYLNGLGADKRRAMHALHALVLKTMPGCMLWLNDGLDTAGRVVSNPCIGYGSRTIRYANGTTREAFRAGISANNAGLSVYLMAMPDKTILARKYAASIGRATVTGYCIKFRKLEDVDLQVLAKALHENATSGQVLPDASKKYRSKPDTA